MTTHNPQPAYNLSFWTRVFLPIIYLNWLALPKEERKTWHQVKKGMEKHECNYIVPIEERFDGRVYKLLKCKHEGCNVCWLVETPEEILKWWDNSLKGTKQDSTEV